MAPENENLITLTADIVAAHVGNNNVAIGDVGTLIEKVYGALNGLNAPPEPVDEKPKGAVSIRASIKPDHLISMIDGKSYRMLKRHITLNGYTPESYRETFGLPKDYPMVAATYAEKRRALAKEIGLGRGPRKATATKPKAQPAKTLKPRFKKVAPTDA